ncbi:MAG: hypothetical protein MZV64_15360 [Ignavibacteriales bacterium]|nr:hypothetical protein [Ignavibacteriales bacterium]
MLESYYAGGECDHARFPCQRTEESDRPLQRDRERTGLASGSDGSAQPMARPRVRLTRPLHSLPAVPGAQGQAEHRRGFHLGWPRATERGPSIASTTSMVPDRKLHQIPVEHPVSITGGSGSHPHRQLHREPPDDNPLPKRAGQRRSVSSPVPGQAAVLLLGQARRAVTSAVVLDEVEASGLPLSVAEDNGHLAVLRLPLLLRRLLCEQCGRIHEGQRQGKRDEPSHFILLRNKPRPGSSAWRACPRTEGAAT